MKKILTLVAIAMCMLAAPQITHAATSTVGTVTATPSLNLRQSAVSSAAVLASIPKNTQVTIISKSASNWYNVTYNGKTGWISGSYLSVTSIAATTPAVPKPTVPAPTVANKTVGTVTASPTLNLRKTAVTTSAVLAAIPKNAQVDVISKNTSNWYNITYNGQTGWVSGTYLTVKTIVTAPTPTPVPVPTPVVPAPTVANKTVGTVTASPALNLRKTALTTSAVLTAIPKNAQVDVITKNTNNWYNITYNGQTGWASGSYLTVNSVAVTAPVPVPVPVTTKDPSLVGKTIVIDPGHGAPDTGAIGPTGTKEKDNNLAISYMLATALKAGGANVIMTRLVDNSPASVNFNELSDLQFRSTLANNAKADIFVSIHNDSFSPTVSGTTTYYSQDNPKAALSMQLATAVQAELIKALGTSNRGVKEAAFYVIKNTTMPAILVETAFISNAAEEQKLSNNTFRQSAANAIMKGIVTYLKQH